VTYQGKQEDVEPVPMCPACRAWGLEDIRHGLTKAEWRIVERAVECLVQMREYLSTRQGRIKPSHRPESADEYISRHVPGIRRQCTLLSRTVEYARLLGYIEDGRVERYA